MPGNRVSVSVNGWHGIGIEVHEPTALALRQRYALDIRVGDFSRDDLVSETFDAIIINGKMPGDWGAPEVYHWLTEKYAGMEKRTLFTFSSVADQEIRKFLQENNVPLLVKPFEVVDLIKHARGLLQQKAQAASAD